MTAFGTCGFCGFGDGHLGEQGEDLSQVLHAAARFGEPGKWTYSRHPGAFGDGQRIHWCGQCVAGLKHKYQRYDDGNLRALGVSYRVRLELDGLRWTAWDKDVDPGVYPPDDPAVHAEKLRGQRDLADIETEQSRRAGFDLVANRGWRP